MKPENAVVKSVFGFRREREWRRPVEEDDGSAAVGFDEEAE